MRRVRTLFVSSMVAVAFAGCDSEERSAEAPAEAEAPAQPDAPEGEPGAGRAPTMQPPSRAEGYASGDAAQAGPFEQVWRKLGQTTNFCPDTFDYWPHGGILITACHLGSVDPKGSVAPGGRLLGRLRTMAPMKIYVSGPHHEHLAVGEAAVPDDFGRYNPEFVKWFIARAVPAQKDAELRRTTQPFYDKFHGQAETFEAVHAKIEAEPRCFQAQKKAYLKKLEAGQGQPTWASDWTSWLDEGFCEGAKPQWGANTGHDPNITSVAFGFWMRRDIDGTRELWHQGLTNLRETYGGGGGAAGGAPPVPAVK